MIHEYDVKMLFLAKLDSLLSGLGRYHIHAVTGKYPLRHDEIHRLVVDYESSYPRTDHFYLRLILTRLHIEQIDHRETVEGFFHELYMRSRRKHEV